MFEVGFEGKQFAWLCVWWWWRSWERGRFRQRHSVRTEGQSWKVVGHLRKSKKPIGGRITCARDLGKTCWPSLGALSPPSLEVWGVWVCVCPISSVPQDVTWPKLWTATSRSNSYLPQEWVRSAGKPGERRAKGWKVEESSSVAFGRLKTHIRHNYNTPGLFICQALYLPQYDTSQRGRYPCHISQMRKRRPRKVELLAQHAGEHMGYWSCQAECEPAPCSPQRGRHGQDSGGGGDIVIPCKCEARAGTARAGGGAAAAGAGAVPGAPGPGHAPLRGRR